jgi:hypothetical protein
MLELGLPLVNVKRPRIGKRRRSFERSELAKFLRAAAVDLRLYFITLRESISRPQETRALDGSHLRTCDATIPLRDSLATGHAYFELEEFKHRHLRTDPDTVIIPITPRLGRLLQRIAGAELPKTGLILRTKRARAWTKEAVRLRVKRLRVKLKIGADKRGAQIVA